MNDKILKKKKELQKVEEQVKSLEEKIANLKRDIEELEVGEIRKLMKDNNMSLENLVELLKK